MKYIYLSCHYIKTILSWPILLILRIISWLPFFTSNIIEDEYPQNWREWLDPTSYGSLAESSRNQKYGEFILYFIVGAILMSFLPLIVFFKFAAKGKAIKQGRYFTETFLSTHEAQHEIKANDFADVLLTIQDLGDSGLICTTPYFAVIKKVGKLWCVSDDVYKVNVYSNEKADLLELVIEQLVGNYNCLTTDTVPDHIKQMKWFDTSEGNEKKLDTLKMMYSNLIVAKNKADVPNNTPYNSAALVMRITTNQIVDSQKINTISPDVLNVATKIKMVSFELTYKPLKKQPITEFIHLPNDGIDFVHQECATGKQPVVGCHVKSVYEDKVNVAGISYDITSQINLNTGEISIEAKIENRDVLINSIYECVAINACTIVIS